MAEMTYRDALNLALKEEMRRDPSVVIWGEDVALYEGSFKVTRGLLAEFGEERVKDTPISENTIIGVAVGAAMGGLAAGGGTDDGQLRPAGHGSDHQPYGQDPLHVRRQGRAADCGADAGGRRKPVGRPALPEPGSIFHALSRPLRGGTGYPRRCQGVIENGHP